MRERIHDLIRRAAGMARVPLRSRRGKVTATVTAVVLAAGTVASISAASATTASASGSPAYLNPRLPVQARVADLLGRMTLPEKIGQMVQIEVI